MFRAVNASAPAASSPAPRASGIRAAVGTRPAAIPPGVHRMPRWEAADRIITGTTLGEHDRLRGPFSDNADSKVPVWPGHAAAARRCSSATRRAARWARARTQRDKHPGR